MPRISDSVKHLNDFLVPKEKVFHVQYAGLYFTRLQLLRPRLSSPVINKPVLDVLPGQTAFILGTLYIDAPLKPNVLDSVTRNVWESAPPPREKYCAENDIVYLEDESGRVKLLMDSMDSERVWVSGTVLGFVGTETVDGDFRVKEVIYPSFIPKTVTNVEFQESWIALVSGLNLGKSSIDVSIQLLVDFLTADKSISDVKYLKE